MTHAGARTSGEGQGQGHLGDFSSILKTQHEAILRASIPVLTYAMTAVSHVPSETATEPQASGEPTINIGTRRSMLARVQTDEVEKALKKAWPQRKYEIHAMSTTGDLNQVTALHEFNAKALWTQELETLLEQGKLDLIVHSLKDMPTQLPSELILGCIFPREDPRDALVIKPSLVQEYKSLAALPEGSVVGTSSLRRTAQLKRYYPHLKFTDVRGNIGTRLAKLDNPESEYAAIILAVAGLKRLGMGDRISTYLSKHNGGMLHAVGQGALGVEIRKGDEKIKELLSKVGCERTTRACLAERSLMRTLEGGCSVPIGVETEWVSKKSSLASNVGSDVGVGAKPAADYHQLSGVAKTDHDGVPADEQDELTDELIMRALVVSLNGQEVAEVETKRVVLSRADADEFGWEVARKLVDQGADKILEKITLNRNIIEQQGDA